MNHSLIWLAFVLGLSSTVHCWGMCGGLLVAFATPGQGTSLARALAFNLGRASSYVLGGAIAGAFGQVVASVGAPGMGHVLLQLCAAAATCSGLFTWWALSRSERTGPPASLAVENPFELAEVIKFSLLLTVILFGAQLARDAFGDSGFLVLAAISGIADVDAITLTAARLSVAPPSREIAAAAILVAVFVNNLAKVALSAWAGSPRLGAWVLAGTLPGAVAAGAVFLTVSR
ncbi:MAG: DUF4010 domain-containing protein [Gammaproteobacteria bacterium]|nr:DUF4010 domain-containing protein [Gammaproteobacteria bacterium]